jgi:ribosomal protein S27AE
MPNRRQRKKNAARPYRLEFRYWNRAIMVVKHAALRRFSSNSMFKRECPRCHEGVLLVARDPTTYRLLDRDRCVLCGQRVRYTDMDQYRRHEAGE